MDGELNIPDCRRLFRSSRLALFLLCIGTSAFAAPTGILTQPSPGVLFERFTASVGAEKAEAFGAFIQSYLPLVSKGEGKFAWDEDIAAYLPPDRRSSLVATLSEAGMNSTLQETCLEYNAKERLEGPVAERARAAAALYRSLGRTGSDVPAAAALAEELALAWRWFPSPRTAASLESNLAAADDRLGLFRFRLRRSLDESDFSFFSRLRFRVTKLFTRGTGSWTYEYTLARDALGADILRLNSNRGPLPLFGAAGLENEAGGKTFLSFTDPASPIHAAKTILVFFKTSCGYCASELKALDRWLKRADKAGSARPKLAAIELPSGLPEPFDALGPYEKGLGVSLDFYKAGTSGIAEAYGASTVPWAVLFDERGRPLSRLGFRNQANLDGKLDWILDRYLSDLIATTLPTIEAASSAPPSPELPSVSRDASDASLPLGVVPAAILVELYADPSCGSCEDLTGREIPALEGSSGMRFELQSHDIMDPAAFEELSATLAAQGLDLGVFPVAVIDGAVFQGIPEIRRGLTAAADQAGAEGGEPPPSLAGRRDGENNEPAIPEPSAMPVFLAGLAAGVNPCSFSALLLLFPMLPLAGLTRRGILIPSTIYASVAAPSRLITGVALLALLVSLFELACIGQGYLPITAWLLSGGDPVRGIGLIVLHNAGFILPFLLVLILFLRSAADPGACNQ